MQEPKNIVGTCRPEPEGYPNLQKWINTGPGGKYNLDRLNELTNSMNAQGWSLVFCPDWKDTVNAESICMNLEKGNRIRYVTNSSPPSDKTKEVFRTGGWLIECDPEGDTGTGYILYRGHNCTIWSVQIDHLKYLWTISRENDEKNKKLRIAQKPAVFDPPGESTVYPVSLYHEGLGKEVIVYYAKDTYKKKRFMNTDKFKRAQANGWGFKR